MREEGSWRTPEQSRSNMERMLRSLQGWDLRPRAEEAGGEGACSGDDQRPRVPERHDRSLRVAQGHPNSEFIINQGCHHACPRENPALWNGRVHAFLRRHGL